MASHSPSHTLIPKEDFIEHDISETMQIIQQLEKKQALLIIRLEELEHTIQKHII